MNRPALTSGTLNTLVLLPLEESFAGFPQTEMLGWGQQAMRLDQVPVVFDGRNVRVAVIDSGAAALTHPDLAGIDHGVDLTTSPSNPTNWTDDTIAHGSHCSGIISGPAALDPGHAGPGLLLVGFYQTRYQFLFVASLIAIVPVVVLFASIERHLVGGLTAGSVR